MKIKTLLLGVGLALGLAFTGNSQQNANQNAIQQSPYICDFLRGNQGIYLSNNASFGPGQPGVGFIRYLGYQNSALNQFYTNPVFSIYSNATALAFSLTNFTTTNFDAGTNTWSTNVNYFGRASYDAETLPSDRNGNPSSLSLKITAVGTLLTSSNTMSFTLAKRVLYQGGSDHGLVFYATNTTLANASNNFNLPASSCTFYLTLNGTTPVTLVTNLPTTLTQGAMDGMGLIVTNLNIGAASSAYILAAQLVGDQP